MEIIFGKKGANYLKNNGTKICRNCWIIKSAEMAKKCKETCGE